MTLGEAARRWGDAVLAVVLAGLFAADLVVSQAPHLGIAMPCGIGASLALALRRRTPLVSFLLCLGLVWAVHAVAPHFVHESIAVLLLFMFNLFSLGANADGTEAWLGAGGVCAAIVFLALGDPDHTLGGWAFYATIASLPWAAGVAIRTRVERVREVTERNAALIRDSERAVQDERDRIARELHDVVSHAIAVTVLQSRGAAKMVGRDDDVVRRALGAIESTNTAALTDMRRLLAVLREGDSDGDGRQEPAPTLAGLDSLVAQVRASGLPVELDVAGERLLTPPGVDLSAYRIVQEALTNVLKHAGPDATARVEVRYGEDDLAVEVVNSGVVPTGVGTGHGLTGIRERAAVVGGTVDAGPRAGGFAVRVRLPYLISQP